MVFTHDYFCQHKQILETNFFVTFCNNTISYRPFVNKLQFINCSFIKIYNKLIAYNNMEFCSTPQYLPLVIYTHIYTLYPQQIKDWEKAEKICLAVVNTTDQCRSSMLHFMILGEMDRTVPERRGKSRPHHQTLDRGLEL